MSRRNLFPHGGDLSIYPTIDVMREAYLHGYYRTYPHEAYRRIGAPPPMPADTAKLERETCAQTRPRWLATHRP